MFNNLENESNSPNQETLLKTQNEPAGVTLNLKLSLIKLK
jgi:hypothetical protein